MERKKMTAYSSLIIPAIFAAYAFFIFPLPYALAFLAIFIIYAAGLYSFLKKADEVAMQKAAFFNLTIGMILLAFTYFNLIILFITVIATAGAYFAIKTYHLRDIAKILVMFAVILIAATMFLQPTIGMAVSSPPVLDDNWWAALNWIQNNTDSCGVVTTYWDPGHFIRAIANRPVVFDGASQNALWNTTLDANSTQDEIKNAALVDNYLVTNTSDGKIIVETARIQDISTTLLTSNETQAVSILDKYREPGCKSMYYLATADLVDKSYWWTYFGSWTPENMGCAIPMTTLSYSQTSPYTNGSVAYSFQGPMPSGCNQEIAGQIIVLQTNSTFNAYEYSGGQLLPIEKVVYYSGQNVVTNIQQNPGVQGMVIIEPGLQNIVFIPPELENSMFTKMFFFNGQGLGRFKLVNSWGGEVKLFQISYP